MAKTVSETLVDGLVGCGITHVYGVVGDALNSVTDAIRRTDGIDWIATRHEEVAAFAAGAAAQLTGRLGVCAGTVGPGAIHLLNGLYDAAKSHAPVLAITGQVPLPELGSNYFQEVDNDHLFRDVSVFNRTITSPGQVPQLIEQAIEAAVSRRGVAVLSLPGDVGPQQVSGKPKVRVFNEPAASVPSDKLLDQAAKLINGRDRVTILAGAGASGARDAVLGLAGSLAAPIVVTLKGKETFDWDNPYQVGQTGLIGNPAAVAALEDCELLLMIGTDFPYRDWYPEGPTVVQIDAVSEHIGRRTRVDLGLVGDAALTVEALAPRLRGNESRRHLDKAVKAFRKWHVGQERLAAPDHDREPVGELRSLVDNPDHHIRPESVALAVNELADDTAIFTADTGMSTVWLSRFVQFRQGQRLLGSFNLGSMANAMPQAIGAATAFPDRQVIAFCGDGGLTMLLGDILTAVRYRLPVKLIVFDNHRLGMVKLEQEQAGLPEFGTVLPNPDLAAVAEAMGAKGIRVTEPGELHKGLAEAFAADGPVLVDVLTNPEEVSVPGKVLPGQAWGFAIAKVKETLRPQAHD
ncbi:thiamine pyrophosphate-dependent enzyme [Stackebrandtia nassauensis]|uniref:Thiamine pyrophosphate protein TPP binding domain protein n=1 Tax=Stackebrandtia nassauensis (strain DSM 44728 / CIP 108903 / NRRL B-16338 / NBRC 102104 / LLR-40K-21) TaxID=446470 RepID=D3Q893_STANL|nr:thiamine pyrophosphate-dependent enzyme [Stackebrandtia nassauensis]ADD42467.1 thiamine pyrophosphate protein TPP binding domain protein [Stackebrandtia nassauensis DSM 44728]